MGGERSDAERLNALEAAVLAMLFEGEHPALKIVRRQVELAKIVSRNFTGKGFFTDFALPIDAPKVALVQRDFGDVEATIPGLEHGAGFVVFFTDGKIENLEGYCYGETWPEHVDRFELRYWDSKRPAVEETFGPINS